LFGVLDGFGASSLAFGEAIWASFSVMVVESSFNNYHAQKIGSTNHP